MPADCHCCPKATCPQPDIQVQTREVIPPAWISYLGPEGFYAKVEAELSESGSQTDLKYQMPGPSRLYRGLKETQQIFCSRRNEPGYARPYTRSRTLKMVGSTCAPETEYSNWDRPITNPDPDEYSSCFAVWLSDELQDPVALSAFQECLDDLPWGGTTAGHIVSGTAGRGSNWVHLIDMRWRFLLPRGCHPGCWKVTLLTDDVHAAYDSVGDRTGYLLTVADIITNGRGTSADFLTTKDVTGGAGEYQLTTDIRGLVVSHHASGEVFLPVGSAGGLPGIGLLPLNSNHNQYAAWRFDTTSVGDTLYIDTAVPPECPTSSRYSDWFYHPLPEFDDFGRRYIRLLLDQTFFEPCEGALSFPCGDPSPSSFAASRMMTMAAAPGGSNDGLMETAGPPLWADLHGTAQAGNLTPEWLAEFALQIPCGICRTHWLEILKGHPPRYDDQYAWSVEVHNLVNVRLGKPVWTGA